MTPRTVPIVCAAAPRHIVYVPAVRTKTPVKVWSDDDFWHLNYVWRCSWCGARVKVVA